MRRLPLALALFCSLLPAAETIKLAGLKQPVEILRDRWGVPHIYAKTTEDLFFAQGYITARDRLWQLDTWRRTNSGRLSEVLGPKFTERDRLARLLRFHGDWKQEWASYAPDAEAIATAFTSGINAYIDSLNGKRPPEFAKAGFDPGHWEAQDVTGRVAMLSVVSNATREVLRARFSPPDDPNRPEGVAPADIPAQLSQILIGLTQFVDFEGAKGSNNWVVDGTMTASGKPLLANDPHRVMAIPSLRKTVHLVGPGWNAIGAGEPALPGIALGHNENIAFGFTIVGIDQQDLYVEKLNPEDHNQYRVQDAWQPVTVVQEQLPVKGREKPETIELRYTKHGPIVHEDPARHLAYALRWVGAEPGGAGYLAGLRLARAQNWSQFTEAIKYFKTPSENLVYADVQGNIGWYAAGLAPVRSGWNGLYPVPGDTGKYEWTGFLPTQDLPHIYNPADHYIATANNNILPPGYSHFLAAEWGTPYRVDRVKEMLKGKTGLTVADFERMQSDVTSLPAQRFVAAIQEWKANGSSATLADDVKHWDGKLTTDSMAAAIYEVWLQELMRAHPTQEAVLKAIQSDPAVLQPALDAAIQRLTQNFGADSSQWKWGNLHQIQFRHDLNDPAWNRGPLPRPGDATTVNATSGVAPNRFPQLSGASYREIFDLSDWDKSVTVNTPGESGDPTSKHYSDLMKLWSEGGYHPMPYSRKAVEAVTEERIHLQPL